MNCKLSYLDKIVGDEVLILEPDLLVFDEFDDRLIVDENVALACRAGDGLTGALVHDLRRQVLGPARRAVHVAALQTVHHLEVEF